MLRHRALATLARVAAVAGVAGVVVAMPSPSSTSVPSLASGAVLSSADQPLSCATLRDVGISDVVRVDAATMLYADDATGLTLVDVGDAVHPRVTSVVPFVGTPVALFANEGIAWVVFVDWDSRSGARGPATVVRAIDVREPSAPRVLGNEIRDGAAVDAKLVGGLLYVLRPDHRDAMPDATRDSMRDSMRDSIVEGFGLRRGRLVPLERVALPGVPAQLAASSAGLAAATDAGDHATLTWIDLSMERPGSLEPREPVRLPGGVATGEHGAGRVVDADDGQRVRIVTCATRSCAAGEPVTLRTVDFSAGQPSRTLTSLRLTEHGGRPLTRFADGVLYVGERSPSRRETTTLRVVLTDERVPRVAAHLPLRGRLTTLVPHDDTVVALGTVGSPEAGVQIIVHDVDVHAPASPRARGYVTFGSDWTWTAAEDAEQALSFAPSSHLVAIPFTAWRRGAQRSVSGAQLVELSPFGARTAGTIAMDGYVERAVLVDGELVTIGPDGVTSIDFASTRRADRD